MTMNNPLAAVLSRIKNAERLGKRSFTTHQNSRLIREILDILKREGHIVGYTATPDVKGATLTIELSGRLNDTGVITPNFAVAKGAFERFEKRYLPSKDFGIIILTTTKGIMTHKEAKEAGLGGKLLAYAY